MKINPNGFREYDARWLFEKDIDLEGITNLGKGLGTQIITHTQKNSPRVIVGHDYRSYSEKVAEGSGANVLEDPREALSWLVNDVGSRGVSIGAGELVTTGTCVVPVPVSPGDEILADFGVLGQVETRFN